MHVGIGIFRLVEVFVHTAHSVHTFTRTPRIIFVRMADYGFSVISNNFVVVATAVAASICC